jgi:hypothetical protein
MQNTRLATLYGDGTLFDDTVVLFDDTTALFGGFNNREENPIPSGRIVYFKPKGNAR